MFIRNQFPISRVSTQGSVLVVDFLLSLAAVSQNEFQQERRIKQDKMKQTYEELAREKNIPNPLNRAVEKKIDAIKF